MQIFRKIVRASFEIVSGTGDLDVVYFHQLGAGPYPRLKDKSPSKRRGHLALEAKQTTRRQGGGELVVEEEMKVHELLNNGVKRCQHTKMLSDSSVWGKSVIRRIG